MKKSGGGKEGEKGRKVRGYEGTDEEGEKNEVLCKHVIHHYRRKGGREIEKGKRDGKGEER